jgi:small subunit ribosomal protein S13
MTEQKTRYIIRIFNTDLDGHKPLHHALTKIKGVSAMMANAVCVVTGIEPNFQTGNLTEALIKKINGVFENPIDSGIPAWILNRRKDPVEGKDMHLLSSNLDFVQSNDKKMMQKIKCYRGVRHYLGLPSRGQRTRSNFRRNKGKAAGVVKKSQSTPPKK